MIRRFIGSLLPMILVALIACRATLPTGVSSTPKLVVFITVDQMRPDYLPRFESQLTGGLGMLYRGGAVFTNGFQDHAITETAPGHSATMSGRFPVHTGIVTNIEGVNDTTVTLVDAVGVGDLRRLMGEYVHLGFPSSRIYGDFMTRFRALQKACPRQGG